MHTVLFYCVLILICVFSGFVGSLFSYSSGLLQCHWGNCNCPNASKRNMNARDNILQKQIHQSENPMHTSWNETTLSAVRLLRHNFCSAARAI